MEDGYEITVFGLVRKRAELSGAIDATRDKLTQMMADLDHLDAAIRILDPAADDHFDKSKRPPAMFAGFRGELSRFILDTLRGGERLTTREMTERVMLARQLDPADANSFWIMGRRVGNALRTLSEKHEQVRSESVSPRGLRRWWMA